MFLLEELFPVDLTDNLIKFFKDIYFVNVNSKVKSQFASNLVSWENVINRILLAHKNAIYGVQLYGLNKL